jgi:hypothetical protein
VLGFRVSKTCDPIDSTHTSKLTYALTTESGEALPSFLSFDPQAFSINVAFQSTMGTFELILRGTLPNLQTTHETFTVIITEKPPIFIDEIISSSFGERL